ncbi:MAG: PadR family transcriptional regulator [Rhodospirillaceae bacterium]
MRPILPVRKTNPDFMTGVPELLILRLLSAHEMYGYELVQAIETASGEAIKLGEGVVYPALHALEEQGCLKSRRKPVNGRTRVYYIATAAGKKRLRDMTGEWQRITEAVAGIVMGAKHAAI